MRLLIGILTTSKKNMARSSLGDLIGNSIKDLKVMPSMRCLMTAGPALERDNVAGFNCSYLAIDHPRAFDEILYLLMCRVWRRLFGRASVYCKSSCY